MKKIKNLFKKRIEILVFITSLIFSWWLMFSTFSFRSGSMLIASKAWSDFASHIPLIRSFSFGYNFPPQYPLFSGPPIKYHFLFYALVGFLEKIGIRIDYALNIPSILGFSLLLIIIFLFAKLLFKSTAVGILSILFFLFNGSLTFIRFVNENVHNNLFVALINSTNFTSFGPYKKDVISAFWNLNIYTNQRHLALSFFISLLLIYLVIKPFIEDKKQNPKLNLFVGIALGLSFYLNTAAFLMTSIVLIFLLIALKKFRRGIFISLIFSTLLAIPQYLMSYSASNSSIVFYPGYLINSSISLFNFIDYWFQNLGLHLILIPVGFMLASRKIKIIFVSFFILFLVANLFKFSPEIAANHKFFNFFMIIGVMFTSYSLIILWNKKNLFKPIAIVISFFLILSGIVDFFPIYNDSKIALADYGKNKDVSWIIANTEKNAIFLNTNYLYDNASIAGRKIFLGWPYFAWSQGYDTISRDTIRNSLFSSNQKEFFCKNITKYKINYVEINLKSSELKEINRKFLDINFSKVYKNDINDYYIYKIGNSCELY